MEITRAQIEALRTEAGEAGDPDMVETCNRALAGDEDARRECLASIADAAAQADSTRPEMIDTWDAAWQAYRDRCGSEGPSITPDELHADYIEDDDAPRYVSCGGACSAWTDWLDRAWNRHETEQAQ